MTAPAEPVTPETLTDAMVREVIDSIRDGTPLTSNHPRGIRRTAMGESTCDKCDGPNDIANESNYCSTCRTEFRARVKRDPEQQPTDVRDWRAARGAKP